MRFFKSLLGSSVLHALLILPFLIHIKNTGFPMPSGNSDKDGKGSSSAEEKQHDLTEQSIAGGGTMEIINEGDVEVPTHKKERNCAKYYGGVGIVWEPFGRTTAVVPEWYPAYKAGIRVGDWVVYPADVNTIKGEIGTWVKIIVQRNHELLTFNIKREKICYTEKEINNDQNSNP